MLLCPFKTVKVIRLYHDYSSRTHLEKNRCRQIHTKWQTASGVWVLSKYVITTQTVKLAGKELTETGPCSAVVSAWTVDRKVLSSNPISHAVFQPWLAPTQRWERLKQRSDVVSFTFFSVRGEQHSAVWDKGWRLEAGWPERRALQESRCDRISEVTSFNIASVERHFQTELIWWSW